MATVASLVVQIGADIADLRKNVAKVDDTLTGMEKGLGSLKTALIGAFTVGAVTSFAKEVIALGGEIEDTAAKLGLSTDAVQELGFAAQQSGSSMEDISASVLAMSRHLSAGDQSAIAALRTLNLEFETVRRMAPEGAFYAIARAIADVPNPMDQARLATELFGKTGMNLLPAIRDNMLGVGDAAPKMGRATVKAMADMGDSIDEAYARLKVFGGELLLVAMNGPFGEMRRRLRETTSAADELAESGGRLKSALLMPDVPPSIGTAELAAKLLKEEIQATEAATRKSTAAAEAYQKKLQDMASGFSGAALAEEVRDIARALDLANKQGGLTTYQFKQLGERLTDLFLQGAALPPVLHAIMVAQLNAAGPSRALAQSFLDQEDSLKLLREGYQKYLTLTYSLPVKKADNPFAGLGGPTITQLVGPSAGSQMAKSVGAAFAKDLGPTILNALQGGGNVAQSIGSMFGQHLGGSLVQNFGKSITGTLGKTIGGAVTALIPGLGALLGPLAGKLAGWIGGLFSGGEGAKVNDARDAFLSAQGGADALYRQLEKIGRLDLWQPLVSGPGKMSAITAAIKDIEAALVSANETAAAQLTAELDARQKLQAAIEKYGFTIEELGPKWQQQELTKQAEQLIEDFTVLTASGIDVDVVLGKMGDSILAFVKTAMKTGGEVPESMRPMLERMLEMGKLVDENGVALKDLSGINFSMTMTEGFQGVIDKLDELIKKITNDLGHAIENIPTPDFDLPDTGIDRSTQGSPGGGGVDDPYPFAKGGIVTRPMVGLVGEAGPEAIIPLSRLSASQHGRGGDVHLHIDAKDAVFADAGSMQRFADTLAPRIARTLQSYRLVPT